MGVVVEMDKSHVSMETSICPVCGEENETGNILLDTRLRERFDKYTSTSWEMCASCQEKIDAGYIALIVARNPRGKDTLSNKDAHRTGEILFVRKTAFTDIFSADLPEHGLAFLEESVAEALKEQFGERETN